MSVGAVEWIFNQLLWRIFAVNEIFEARSPMTALSNEKRVAKYARAQRTCVKLHTDKSPKQDFKKTNLVGLTGAGQSPQSSHKTARNTKMASLKRKAQEDTVSPPPYIDLVS